MNVAEDEIRTGIPYLRFIQENPVFYDFNLFQYYVPEGINS
jgi:hypothetical protein